VLALGAFITGIIKDIKQKTLSSRRMIDKFYDLINYGIGLTITGFLQMYILNDTLPLVKMVCMIIVFSEIQSIRENIKITSGVDFLKPVGDMLKKMK